MASSVEIVLSSRRSGGPPIATKAAWIKKGTLAITDQGLFATSNFVFNILLARWLSPADYGAFALAFSVLLLAGTVHTAALTEPMMVFGPGQYSNQFRKYLGVLILGHFAIMLPISFLLACAGAVMLLFGSAQTGMALIGAAIATPMILLLWLARRSFYVHLRPGLSAATAPVYLVSLLTSAWFLTRQHWLTPASALGAMGICSLAVSALCFALLRPTWSSSVGPSIPIVRAEHWRYGRWSLATVILAWIPNNINYVLLPICLGLETAGTLRALLNLAMPALQGIAAMSCVLMPALVQERERAGTNGLNRTMRMYAGLLSIATLLFACVVLRARHSVMHLVYGNKYTQIDELSMILVCILPFCHVATTTIGNGLRAMQLPDRIFWSYAASTGVSLLLGLPMAFAFGITGAVAGEVLATSATAVVMFMQYRRVLDIGGAV